VSFSQILTNKEIVMSLLDKIRYALSFVKRISGNACTKHHSLFFNV